MFLPNPIQYLLARYGVETAGTIVDSVHYQGDGWHSTDPCFKGRYHFTDRQGRTRSFSFSHYCFDYNDYVPHAEEAWNRFQADFAQGTVFRVRFVAWLPRLHTADIGLPPVTRLDGRMAGLVRDREALFRALYTVQARTSKRLKVCLPALEQAAGDADQAIELLQHQESE